MVLNGWWTPNSYWLTNENQEKDEIENPTTSILYQEMEQFLFNTDTATDIIKQPGLHGLFQLSESRRRNSDFEIFKNRWVLQRLLKVIMLVYGHTDSSYWISRSQTIFLVILSFEIRHFFLFEIPISLYSLVISEIKIIICGRRITANLLPQKSTSGQERILKRRFCLLRPEIHCIRWCNIVFIVFDDVL